MQDKDHIREQFRRKLYDYEAPVPENEWQRLQESLNQDLRMRSIRRRWIAVAAVIVILIVGGLVYRNFPDTDNIPMLTEKTVPEVEEKSMQHIQTEEMITHTDNVVKEKKQVVGEIQPQLDKSDSRGVKQSVSIASGKKKISSEKEGKKTFTGKEVRHRETKKSQVEDERKNDDHLDEGMDGMTNDEREWYIEEFINHKTGNNQSYSNLSAKKNDENTITVAFNAKGGLTSSQRTTNSPMSLRSFASVNSPSDDIGEKTFTLGNLNAAGSGVNQVDIADNISEMVHEQPVSLGFTVSKFITDRLSVETGLMYTYLYSKAKNTANEFKSQETQQLHYLGIPLNANYTLLSFNKLNLYVSLGGMIEKDVYGKYQYVDKTVEPEINGGSEKKVSINIKQKNPQLSVNAGMGLSYPLYDRLGIYGKIGGVYYFDANNEFKTFYSDKKIAVDISIGLMFNF